MNFSHFKQELSEKQCSSSNQLPSQEQLSSQIKYEAYGQVYHEKVQSIRASSEEIKFFKNYSKNLNLRTYTGRGVQTLIQQSIVHPEISAQLYGLINIKKILVKSSENHYKKTLIDGVLIPYLFGLIDKTDNPIFLKQVVIILTKVIERGISFHELLKKRAVPFFIDCLETDDWELLLGAAQAMKIAAKHTYYQKEVIHLQGINRLVQTASEIRGAELMKMCCETVLYLSDFLLENSNILAQYYQVERLLQIGILKQILQKLKQKRKQQDINERQSTIMFLNRMIKSNRSGVSKLIQFNGLLSHLLSLFSEDFGPVRQALCHLFANLTNKGNSQTVIQLFKSTQIVKYYNTCITFNNKKIVKTALEGLIKILKFGEKHKTESLNPISLQFINIKGKKSLQEAYEQFSSDIQEQIFEIMHIIARTREHQAKELKQEQIEYIYIEE